MYELGILVHGGPMQHYHQQLLLANAGNEQRTAAADPGHLTLTYLLDIELQLLLVSCFLALELF